MFVHGITFLCNIYNILFEQDTIYSDGNILCDKCDVNINKKTLILGNVKSTYFHPVKLKNEREINIPEEVGISYRFQLSYHKT